MRVTHILPRIADPFCNYTLEELMRKDRPLTTLYVVEATEAEIRTLVLPYAIDEDRRIVEGYIERYAYSGSLLVSQAGRLTVSSVTADEVYKSAKGLYGLDIRPFEREVDSLAAIRNLL